eukprot:scaffold108215_cov54-Attheya_sp.AAC.1
MATIKVLLTRHVERESQYFAILSSGADDGDARRLGPFFRTRSSSVRPRSCLSPVPLILGTVTMELAIWP